MRKKYYKCRNNKYYTKYTKEEISRLIDYNDFNTVIPFLKDMDYPAIQKEFNLLVQYILKNHLNLNQVIGKYIAKMRLCGFKNFTYTDSDYFNQHLKEKKNNG